ncbi:hypothetical protein K6119_15915 [Paracrocinitomix mangrovi]|uniref:hypothetical protein n=1 Tax=Paracrocinitomix mangrovi TaxID=2862509 RepID=UPI001C8DA31F|nr:hypothetical protein [Paracrocinitomix mangrovi]UKN01216.1 hypothetical protein K6119_15915 [Paracrocinitomix mangrovi]
MNKIFTLLLSLFSFCTFAQQIIQPTSGFKNVTIDAGKTYQYVDDGGATGNYSAGASSLITIYPKKEGQYVSIQVNSFKINSDCRMYIFDGNHPGAQIIGYYYLRATNRKYQLMPGDVITASSNNPSGALSVRFSNANHRETMDGWDFTVSLSDKPGTPLPETTQDCSGAIKVCSDSAITTKASGSNFQELPGPNFWNKILNYGNNGENQSNWYKFEVATPGTIEFLITPHQDTDFDWGLWGPYQSHQCPAFTADMAYRISACDSDNSLVTGLSKMATDQFEGSYGNGWVAAINVKAGEHYVLMIDDWSGNSSTFDLTWKFSDGASLECKQDEEPPTDPPKDSTALAIRDNKCADKIEVKGDVTEVSEKSLGGIKTKVKGGKAPYTYEWKNSSGDLIGTQSELFGVEGGEYDFLVTDSEGCEQKVTFTLSIEVEFIETNEEPKLEANISEDEEFVTVSYPGAFEYKIQNVENETVITGHSVDSDLVDITKLPPGEYRVSLIYKRIKQYTTFVKH